MAGVELERPKAAILGEKGLRKLRYLGSHNGKWRGPATCHWYPLKAGAWLYVDVRDAEHFLGLEGPEGEPLFAEM